MPRRSLPTLTLLAAVVLAAALLPGTPAGRGWLLDRAQGAADAAGYDLSWRDSGGNPWRQVTLRDARVQAPGVDAELARATVGWFLPGLLRGELPLWVTVDGARIQLDPAALETGGGGQGGLPVRPELRALDLAGVQLEVNDAPWTLPDLRTEDLEVRGSGQGVAASGRLRTDEGGLDFDARLGLAPLTLSADVQDVDARIGRHWWRGVTAGRGDGRVSYTPEGGLRADLDLRGGAIAVVGLEVTQVEGPIELRGGVVRTSLTGTGLRGPIMATGRVDVPAREWSASLRATPPLREVAAWGVGDALPPALTPDGNARLWAHASGWTDVTVDGRVEAEGTLDGRPLTLLSDEVRYTRAEGLTAAATGEALGGALTVNAGRAGGEPAWTLGLQDARYGPARDLSADATLQTGPLRGDVTARGVLGDAARLQVDAALADGTIEGSVQGEVTPGGAVDGTLSWRDGAVTGTVRLAGWTPAGQDPLHAELRLDGPPSDLPWTLALQGEAPWTPSLPGARLDADLRGEARGVLRGGALEEIEAALGPLSLSGRLPLATGAGADAGTDAGAEIAWSLAPTPLRAGPFQAVLSAREGTLTGPPFGASDDVPMVARGSLRAEEAAVPPVAADPVEASFQAGWAPGRGVTLALNGPRVDATLGDGLLRAELRDLPVAVGDARGPLNASLRADAADPIGTLRGQASVAADPARIEVDAGGAGLSVRADLPAGARLRGVTLQRAVQLRAELTAFRRGPVTIETAGARLDGALDLDAAEPFRGALRTGGDPERRLVAIARRDPWRLALDGDATLAPVAEALGVPLQGTLTLDGLQARAGGATGTATLRLDGPVPAEVAWRDGVLDGRVDTPAGAAELTGDLALGTEPTAELTHPWGDVRLEGGALRGGGTVPAQAWRGVRAGPLPWSLRPASDGEAWPTLELGESVLAFTDGRLTADVDLPLEIGTGNAAASGGGEAGTARAARLHGRAELLGPDARLDLQLDGPGDARSSLRGPLDAAALQAELPAAVLSSAAGLDADLPGALTLAGPVDPVRRTWSLRGAWAVGDDTLQLQSEGPDPARLEVSGAGLSASLQPGAVHLTAAGATPGTFLPALAGLRLDGRLRADLATGEGPGPAWDGTLQARHDAFGQAELRGDGAALRLTADGAWRSLQGRADGTLLPALDLAVTAQETTRGAEADLRLQAPEGGVPSPADVHVAGSLSWPRLGGEAYALAAQRLDVRGTLANVTVGGPLGGTLRLTDGRPSGALTLPAHVAGQPHPLGVRIAGTLADPQVALSARGAAGEARLDLNDPDADAWGVLEVQAAPAAWPAAAGALDPGGATLRATMDRRGAWGARASAAVAPAGRILRLTADAQGEGTRGTAEWRVTRDLADGAGTLLRGTASLGAGGLEGRADVGSLDLAGLGAWLGTELSGDAAGEVRARLRPGGGGTDGGMLAVQADARLSGRAVGTPVELDVRTGDGDALIRALAGPAEATLTRSAPGLAWEVRAVGPEIALRGELSADLRRLTLDGTAWGAPATLRTAGGENGSLVAVAEASDARASLGVRSGAEGIAVDLDAAAPARAGLPVAGTFSAAGRVRGGRATLQRADLAMLAPAPLRADLSGEVWPALDLRGAARLGEAPMAAGPDGDAAVPADPDASPIAAPGVAGTQALGVTLRGAPTAATLRASLPGLTLRADLDGVRPVAAALSGSGLQAFGLTFTPGPDGLRWDAEGGYAGTAALGLTPGAAGDAAAHAELAAAADGLRTRVDASAGAGPAGGDLTLDATLHGPPWAGRWSGGGELQARLHADPDREAPLQLRAPLDLSGDTLTPTLGGPLHLRGTTTADGTLHVDPGGLTLDLSGDTLTASATAEPDGWNVDARAEGLSLAPWLAGLPGVRLSDATLHAEAQAMGAWGDAPEVRVPGWAVHSAAGRVAGSAHLRGDLAARADVDADLGVLLDGAATGRVHGPLHLQRAPGASWRATTLSGALSLDGVTADGTTADGDLALGGSLVAPDVTANLAFRGEVNGPLRLRLHAATGRIDLDTELTHGDTGIDLRVAGPPGAVRIDATLRTGARTLRASGDATASLDLGAGGPPDLRAGAELTAELTPPDGREPTRRPVGLHLSATGTSLDLGARTPGLALEARLDGARPVGVTLHGDGVRAGGVTLTPGPDGLRWDEMDGWGGRAEVALAGEAGPPAEAGDPAGAPAGTAPLRAHLSGEGPALRVRLQADASAAPNAALRATGRADLDARLTGPPWAGRWSGGGELQARLHADPDREAPLQLRAPLDLSGDTLTPTLGGPLHLRGTTTADGTLHVDPGGLTLDLSGDTLTASATAEPDGWNVDAALDGVPLGPWFAAAGLTQVRDPELAAELHAGGAWGAGPAVRVPSWALRARGAELHGSADGEDGVRLEARLDADLGVLLDGAATGRLHGPLTVDLPRGRPWTAAQLDVRLDADEVRIAGVGVSGAASFSGPAGAPDLAVEARLDGRVQGPLALRLNTEARRLEVDTDLSSDAYGLALTARGGPDALEAEGVLRTPRGPLRARAEGAALLFAGQDGLDGVRIALAPFPSDAPAVRLDLPLARLNGAAEGALQLALDARADPWLRGELVGAAIAGVHLPTLALRSDGATLHASGRGEAGAVTARATVPTGAWGVQLGGLALPGALRLDAEADGTGATGTLAGRLDEAPPAEGDPMGGEEGDGLRLRAARTENATTVAATGRLRGGEVTIDLARDGGGWTGPIRIEGLPTPGGTLHAEGRADGAGAVPEAALEVTLDGPLPVTGRVRAGGPELQAHLDLGARLPGGGALRVTGEAWPALDLRIVSEGAAEATGARLRAEHLLRGAPWRVEGHATVPTAAGAVTLRGRPEDGAPRLEVAPRGVAEGRLQADLPADAPLPAVRRAWADGLRATGQGALSGGVAWHPPAAVTVQDLRWAGAWGALSLAGEVRGGRADLRGRVTDAGDGAVPPPLLSLLRAPFGAGALAYHLEGGIDAAELRVHAAEAGHAAAVERDAPLRLAWAGERRAVRLQVDGGPVQADLALAPGAGLAGELRFDGVTVALPGLPTGTLDATLVADGATATGRASLRGTGRLSADGRADLREWLPAPYRPPGDPDPEATSVSVRLTELPLDEVPAVSRVLPGLGGGLSAVIELRGRRLLAQITAPELTTGARAVPLQLEASGRIGAGEEGLDFGGTWAGSPVQGTLTGEALEVVWTLERFPAQAALEARVGELDAVAEVTGVARVRLPYDAPGRPDVRLATEHVRLERAGAVTTGRFSAVLQDGGVEVDAAFEGQGQWSAVGTLRPEELDFTLRAEDADAGPLLGLVPVLSRLGADARGDLTVRAQGSLASPRLDIETDGLELALAGARYRLETGTATLRDEALSVRTELTGVEPVGGLLTVEGSGRLSLSPWRLRDAAIELDGNVQLPVVGELREVRGALRADAEGRPRLEADARMGAPLRLEGTLWPLDVRLRGEGLALRAPAFLLDESTSDVGLRLRYTEAFVISGGVTVRRGRFALGIRPPPAEPEARRTPNPALQRIRLGDIALVGRRLSFSESFGTAEFEADLLLGGTAAEPRLAGDAEAQRGTFRFSGREFDLERGVAAFERSRGVYPTLEVVANAVFDKRTVLQSMPRGATFEAPSGSTFAVRLAFDAEVVPTPRESRPFRLDLDPDLRSDALVNLPGGDGFTPGARALTEAELVSLVALGRLTPTGDPSAAGLAGGVARSALDSAIDLLILSELQSAVSEALGIDVVEIRTSTLSNVLDGSDDPFGVSLRLGGYLDEGLFASLQIGRLAGGEVSDALTNTLALTYELGPVAFDLSTELAFPDDPTLAPVPALGAALRYDLRPGLSIESGLSFSTPESEARFGVTLRW